MVSKTAKITQWICILVIRLTKNKYILIQVARLKCLNGNCKLKQK